MFEIRIVCDPADTDRITASLSRVFTTGAARVHTARRTDKTRLYITADHHPAGTVEWPTAEQAYAKAPSIISEIGWTARTVTERLFGSETSREFWLRKAALLDRIALADETAQSTGDAAELAVEAARRLMDVDDAVVICDPRHYVRQQYARWTTRP